MRIRKRKNRSSLPPEVLGTDQTNASHVSDRDSSNNTGVSTPYGGLQPTLGKIQLAPDTTDWAELHGDRAVKLAIGLGWQVAIIYLSTLTPTLALEENSSGHNQSLPPRNLISKTIKSRTTSLALSESGASKNWVSSLSKLLDSDYEDASEARHL